MTQNIPIDVFLTPEAHVLEPEDYGLVCNGLRKHLDEQFGFWPKFSYYEVHEWKHDKLMAGINDIPEEERLDMVWRMYNYDIRPRKLSIVYAHAGQDLVVGTAHKYLPLIVVNPFSPDMMQTALHEFGHWCGLEHSPDPQNLMFPDAALRPPQATWDAASKASVQRSLARYSRLASCYY